jgi:hypothetical protein
MVAGLGPRVDVLAEVLLRHRVDESVVRVLVDRLYVPADFEVAVGIVRIGDRKG